MADALAFLHWVAKVDAYDVEFVLARCRPSPEDPTMPPSSPLPNTGFRESTSEALEGHATWLLETPPSSPLPNTRSREFTSEALDRHAMWLLDLDCCRELAMDEDGILQAAKSFWRNDPFYPRPGSTIPEDQRLWQAFKTRFLDTSSSLLHGDEEAVRQLPGMLINKITKTRGVWVKGP
ncbi:hypothetical protein TOPH_00722 [Tolypocladium ophioglossoides CBS 100239]|uniref:DUF3669 domain-containing protein n=1 Tax=Tolypocladium ophioglossoides (strain CBS 100239) TaxID=1163406 RepID=A0A0L0NMW7_TOLOC|nr:hypothetical protein TOPH_00722 [Tolypocladium ophioglossoides CBS 100239]